MTRENVLQNIDNTGIRREADFAVPINGVPVPLPYLVVRTKETFSGSDNGRVQTVKIEWAVALFSTNRDLSLESKLIKALQGVGKLDVTPYPDGTPYSTHFKFTTNQIIR
ncbi:MAG: hypothetical protein IJN67_11735 [Oscillospiraceae bacterium]|nr:hypothetical protein [Oscillospiraceae bacterium]